MTVRVAAVPPTHLVSWNPSWKQGATGWRRKAALPHPVPGRADVGLQVCNPVAGQMVRDHPSESEVGHIVEQGTGKVDPDTPVGYRTVPAPVIGNVESPGVGPGSFVFPIAESWTCQLAENVVLVAVSLVVRRAGTAELTLWLETWSR